MICLKIPSIDTLRLLLFKNLKPEEFQSADFIGEERQQRKRRMFQLYIYESIDGKRKLK